MFAENGNLGLAAWAAFKLAKAKTSNTWESIMGGVCLSAAAIINAMVRAWPISAYFCNLTEQKIDYMHTPTAFCFNRHRLISFDSPVLFLFSSPFQRLCVTIITFVGSRSINTAERHGYGIVIVQDSRSPESIVS